MNDRKQTLAGSPPLGIGIDTGGTFTDIVLFDLAAQRLLRKAKTPTTHGDYAVCIGAAFAALGCGAEEIARLKRVALSTTLATNTVAENRVHPTALVVEPGDVSVPAGLHPRVALLKSYIGFDAVEVVPVSEREVLQKTAPLAPQVESFAVSGYASTRNPAHERQIAEALRRAYGKPVVLGSELTHQLNFVQRAQAAALNAGLLPVILEWLQAVKAILKRLGIACPLYIVKGDGSLMEEEEALQRPVQTLFSGPAASLQGGVFLSGQADAVVIDVGGTTTDIGWVQGGAGRPKAGGIRINDRQIAVDGLEIATFGLAGDSRLMRVGEERFRFVNQRALPFCRARGRFPQLSLARLEQELAGQWHFGDPELIELAALDPLQRARLGALEGAAALTPAQRQIVRALEAGPRRVRSLSAEAGHQGVEADLLELIRRRAVVRIALTPTDLFCAGSGLSGGAAPAFSPADARQALTLYARMLDQPVESLQKRLTEALRSQAIAVLTSFLADFQPLLDPAGPVLERLVELQLAAEGAGPALEVHPRCPIVLVGAGAPVLYAHAPAALARAMTSPADGDVANALGAITSRFVLRETVSIEPLRSGGVELFDHQTKQRFDTLPQALEEARRRLEASLHQRAGRLGLERVSYDVQEEVLEDYAEFSRRTRKELVIARVEARLVGLPR